MKIERRQVVPEIFTGSMADVTFLLIIYFMLTTVFAASRGMDFALPEEDPTRREIEAEESIFVQVTPGGTFEIDGRAMPLSGFAEYLGTMIDPGSTPPKISKPVILRPHQDAPYGAMMLAFDELRHMKDRLGLAEELNISLPTQREIENVWGALGVLDQIGMR